MYLLPGHSRAFAHNPRPNRNISPARFPARVHRSSNSNYLCLRSQRASTKEEICTASRDVNETEEGELPIIDLLRVVPRQGSIPDRNGDRVISELSRRNKLRNAFVDRYRWLKPLQENILQSGQHFCCSSPRELLQSGHDTRRNLLG